MNILGISCYYHDSAAALIQDGVVTCAIEEERLSRKKNDDDYPKKAIEWCLEKARIKPSDIDAVTFYDKPLVKFERLLDNYISLAPRGLQNFVNVIPKWIQKRLWIKSEIYNHLQKMDSNFDGRVVFFDHHYSHAAYTYFTSPFKESAIIIADGVGEWTTTSFGTGKDQHIQMYKDIRWPHSLGLLYSAFTYFLGFQVNEGEYKVMGLSAYGQPKFYDIIMDKLIDVKDDGSFKLNQKYFAYTYDNVMTNSKFAELFDMTPRNSKDKISQIHFDIAASVQKVLEDIMLKIVNYVHQQTQMENLCLGGGVALNGLANYRILTESPFKNIHIPPSPGDAGSSIGSALYEYYNHNKTSHVKIATTAYLGPSYSDKECEKLLKTRNASYQKYERRDLLEKTADLIQKGNVVGWFQGRMEWGPRALGNRSILADPRVASMKDTLNIKIKHRESFRPFAPSILEEHATDYFDLNVSSPYMLFIAKIKQPNKIPAVTHNDGTGRLQTVAHDSNSLYYDLIKEFYKKTNIPVLINTSMNVMGEPIVNTPNQAYVMLETTNMDFLVMESFIVKRNK